MIERRTYAEPLYPGSLFPEHGASIRIDGHSSAREIVELFSHSTLSGWFAIEVTEQNWQLWKTEEGDEKWRPAEDGSRKSYRIYIGELLARDDVAALPGDHKILLSNMEYNDDCDPIVRTRMGNFQPFCKGDVVFAPAEMQA